MASVTEPAGRLAGTMGLMKGRLIPEVMEQIPDGAARRIGMKVAAAEI